MKIMYQNQTFQSFFLPVINNYYLIGQTIQLFINDPKNLNTINQVQDGHIALINLDEGQFYDWATFCEIENQVAQNDGYRLTLVVKNYLKVNLINNDGDLHQANLTIHKLVYNELEDKIALKSMLDAWYQYLKYHNLDQQHYQIEAKIKTHHGFCNWLAGLLKPNEQGWLIKAIIEAKTLGQAYQLFNGHLNQVNLQIASGLQSNLSQQSQIIDNEIENQVKKNFDQYQKETILREKLKVINKKMEQERADADPIQTFLDQIQTKQIAPQEVAQTIKKERAKLNTMQNSPEVSIVKNYLDLLVNLPWKIVTKSAVDVKKLREQLDQDHYGLNEVKERIIEYMAAMQNLFQQQSHHHLVGYQDQLQINNHLFKQKANQTSPTLCLVGPPGVGKTSIARSIAKALDRPFIKIALGGLSDEAELRGHRKTYVGAMSGKIINAIKRAKVSNPVILLDEIDKIQTSFKGNPANVLLEILDPEQNQKFQDHYLEIEYDLSQVLFIATANEEHQIDSALRDRLEIIRLSSYTIFEKMAIAKQHLIPKVYRQHSLDANQLIINDNDLWFLIKHYVQEAGVRNLTQELAKIARKITLEIVEGTISADQKLILTPDLIKKYLGVVKYQDQDLDHQALVGCVNGLAYTGYGGALLPIEVAIYPSQKHELKLTGNLKDVMRESAQIALAYLKANQDQFGIDLDFDHHTIFVHVPAGAIPKDGPSAGITFTSALLSAILKKPVSQAIAMTGEITLRGKVLPIGGLKEKTLAAFERGVKTIYIPQQNEKHLSEVDEEVKSKLHFITISSYEQLFEALFKS